MTNEIERLANIVALEIVQIRAASRKSTECGTQYVTARDNDVFGGLGNSETWNTEFVSPSVCYCDESGGNTKLTLQVDCDVSDGKD
jgi:hypothetical protein